MTEPPASCRQREPLQTGNERGDYATSESLSVSLRKTIFSRMSESDGCYLWIYSGLGEKLSFVSSLLAEQRGNYGTRVLINLKHTQRCGGFGSRGDIMIDAETGMAANESPESFCLRFIREKLDEFNGSRAKGNRILVIADCSSFVPDAQEPLTDKILSLHKDIIDLIHSTRGATGVLLYSIDRLSEGLVSGLLELHGTLWNSPMLLTSQAIISGLQESSKKSGGVPEIKVYDGGIMFLDPASKSAAFLSPIADGVRKQLPYDPLSTLHRNIAFTNNFTAHEGACPYLCSDVPSQCLLDPKVVRAVRTRGQSFVQGRPCITAIDHMVFEQPPEKKTKQKETNDAAVGANPDGNAECFDEPDDRLGASRNSVLPKGDLETKIKLRKP